MTDVKQKYTIDASQAQKSIDDLGKTLDTFNTKVKESIKTSKDSNAQANRDVKAFDKLKEKVKEHIAVLNEQRHVQEQNIDLLKTTNATYSKLNRTFDNSVDRFRDFN